MYEELRSKRPEVEFEIDVGPSEVAFFHEHGFLRVERITTDEELAWLAEIYDRLFDDRAAGAPGAYFDLTRPYDAPGEDLLPQIIQPQAVVPELSETALVRNGRRLASRILRAPIDEVTSWGHMIRKPARIAPELPWHQDEAYWPAHLSYQALGVWTPLDPATLESGCLAFVPGSHRGPVLEHDHIGSDPSIHGLRAIGPDTRRALAVPLPPGGATLHHPRLLHSSLPNRSEQVRRAFANEFQLRPTRRAVPEPRPWLDAGNAAWEARQIPRTPKPQRH